MIRDAYHPPANGNRLTWNLVSLVNEIKARGPTAHLRGADTDDMSDRYGTPEHNFLSVPSLASTLRMQAIRDLCRGPHGLPLAPRIMKLINHIVRPTPAATIPPDIEENGRLYHGYRRNLYPYPCDEMEKNRLDIYHTMFKVARRDELHSAPLNKTAEDVRILDLGTGTGIWAIEMADMYPEAEVVGIDLSNMQPPAIPKNLRFRVPKDFEGPSWALGEDSWDLIHVRQACGSVSSWPELYQKVFAHLKPGQGYLEQIEIDLEPRCDDRTLPRAPIIEWYEYLRDATRRIGKPIEYQHNTRQMLETAGFTDIQERVIRAPFNTWPKDPQQKQIGRWYCVGLSDAIEAYSLAPFTRAFHWPAYTVRRYTEDVQKCLKTKAFHGYNNIHVWTARRPA